MSFINFNNKQAITETTYSARVIAEALYNIETKNVKKINEMVSSIKEPVQISEAIKLFSNKIVALSALQAAAANALPVNEGQFSWMTQDTGEQIGSERENRITVYMFDNEGNQYKEDKYDGYGEFGGMDYYELLAKMNGYGEEDLEAVKGPFKEIRQLGIDVAFGKLKTKDKGKKVLYPALVTDPRYNWKKHDFTQEAESDPDQSWYVEPEYDEEYYEAQKIEEAKSIAKIQKEWAKVTAMMKDTVDKWKAAEGQEKEDLLTQLKTLTISKKKLEVELDDAVGLKDADAELVGEAKNEIKYYKTISKKDWDKASNDYKSVIDGEHYMMFLDDKLGSILAPVKVEEAYTEDDINTGYGFYGTINMEEDDKTTQQLFDRSVKDLMKEFKVSEEAALAVLNSKMGRKAADQIIDGQSKTAVDALKDYYGKSLKKEMDGVIAANEGLTWDSLIEKVKNVTEDWGSSDQSIMNKAIHKDVGSPKKMPSPFDSKLRAAAESAVDFYWDDWKEYETDRDGLIDNAVRGYLRSYFKKDWDLMVRMFEPMESVVTEAKYDKKKLLKLIKNQDDAEILVNGKWYIIYNPDNGNDENTEMWAADDYIYALDPDGEEFEIKYKDIEQFKESVEVNEADMNDPVLVAFRAARMKREKELAKPKRKPLYGKQREKAEDDLWQISQDLKDLYADRGQMLIDMEQEAEVEGGPIADEYGDKLNKIEDEIQKLIAKRSSLEIRLAESFELLDEGRSINKIQKEWGTVTTDMKNTVEAWKTAEGKEKEDLFAKLKDLTAKKKALEKELDAAVQLKDVDAELVGESVNEAEVDLYAEIENEISNIYSKLNDLAEETTDTKWRKAIEGIIKGFEGVESKISQASSKLGIVPTNEGLIGPFFVSDNMTDEELKKMYDDALSGYAYWQKGFEYPKSDYKKAYTEIQKILKKRGVKVDEKFNEEEDYSDEMSFGQLERCIDYSTMIRERIEAGTSLDPWMHSQIAVAENELNSVFDAIDGDDGVVETLELTESVMADLHRIAGEVKDEEEFVKQFFKEYGAKVKKNPESTEWVKSLYADTVKESVVSEAKTLDRDAMMDWLDQTLSFTRTSEEFDGAKGGIWTTGENGEEWKGKVIYAYYSEDYKNRTFGVLNSWEKELNKRGWYSEWYDAGTVMIWPN